MTAQAMPRLFAIAVRAALQDKPHRILHVDHQPVVVIQAEGDPYDAAALLTNGPEPVRCWMVRCGDTVTFVTEAPQLGGAA